MVSVLPPTNASLQNIQTDKVEKFFGSWHSARMGGGECIRMESISVFVHCSGTAADVLLQFC